MKFLFWIVLFASALFAEFTLLPDAIGSLAPVVSFAVLIMGIAWQEFWPGLVFTGLSGFLRDSVSPTDVASHTLFFIAVILFMWLFREFSGWDEPACRIGAIVGAFVFLPIFWNASSIAMEIAFNISTRHFLLSDMHSRWFLVNSIASALWLLILSWGLASWSRKQRFAIASRLS